MSNGLLVVGLGNPGAQYASTRHNIGWMLLDRLAKHFDISFSESPFRGVMASVRIGPTEVHLLKPQTFMNLSGESVAPAMASLNLDPGRIVVAVDEIQLAAGRLKFSMGGSSGGQNGVQSVIDCLRSSAFFRLKLGVGPHPKGESMRDFVLQPIGDDQIELVDETLELAKRSLIAWCEQGADANAFSKVISHANAKNNQPLELKRMRERAELEASLRAIEEDTKAAEVAEAAEIDEQQNDVHGSDTHAGGSEEE